MNNLISIDLLVKLTNDFDYLLHHQTLAEVEEKENFYLLKYQIEKDIYTLCLYKEEFIIYKKGEQTTFLKINPKNGEYRVNESGMNFNMPLVVLSYSYDDFNNELRITYHSPAMENNVNHLLVLKIDGSFHFDK